MNSSNRKKLQASATKLRRVRDKESEAWEDLKHKIKEVYRDPGDYATFEEIGQVIGVTKARVFQIVTGRRSGSKSKEEVSA